MIRLSCESDIKNIVSLWIEAFGDGEDEIMFFIRNRYKPENTVVCEENGNIVSMLFLLDGQMCIRSIDYPSYYLYAACTSKEFRGRGIMASLLDFAKNIAQNRVYRFICLKPAEQSLFDFYKKHGYKSVFTQKLLTVYKTDIIKPVDIFEFTAQNNLAALRNNAYKNYDYFKWDNSAVDFAINYAALYSGKTFISREGYMLYTADESTINVKEITFTQQKLIDILSNVILANNAEKIYVVLPEKFITTVGSYEIVPSGMILPLDDTAKHLTDTLSGAYLGLTLD